MDKKCDALAYTNSDQKVVFQFKYHADETLKEGSGAIEEVAEARKLYRCRYCNCRNKNTSFQPQSTIKSKRKKCNSLGWGISKKNA